MIPEHRLPRLLHAARRGPARYIALVVLLAPLALIGACDRVPLLAPTGTTITLFTSTQLLPLNGSAEVTASVLESGGTPVQNGTVVTFTTSLGRMEPAEGRTSGGKATVRLMAGTQSGTAEINAFSGASQAAAKISVPIGAAAVGTVLVNAEPTRVPSTGGTSQIIATVQDTGGNVLAGVPVTFTTTTGTLSPGTATSGSDGRASSTLTTNQDATVTVTAGAKTGTAAVTATAIPVISLTPPASTPTVGLSVNFSITITPGNAAAPIRSATIDWDDGGTLTSLGAVSGSITVPHTFVNVGLHEIEVTATDALNQTTQIRVPVDVFPPVPFPMTVTAPSARSGQQITITATPGAGAPRIDLYLFEFGDGEFLETPKNSVPHTYTLPAGSTPLQRTVVVTAFVGTNPDTRTVVAVGSTFVTITP